MNEDMINPKDLWAFGNCDLSEFNSMRGKIEEKLKAYLKIASTKKGYVDGLIAIQEKSEFEDLLDKLTHEAFFHNMGISRVNYASNKLSKLTPANKKPRGNQRKPETAIFLRGIREAISVAIGKKCGLYQNPGMTCEGVTISISRIVADGSKTHLAENIRRHIEKARKIEVFK